MTAFTSFFANESSSAIFWISSDFDIIGSVPSEKVSLCRLKGLGLTPKP